MVDSNSHTWPPPSGLPPFKKLHFARHSGGVPRRPSRNLRAWCQLTRSAGSQRSPLLPRGATQEGLRDSTLFTISKPKFKMS